MESEEATPAETGSESGSGGSSFGERGRRFPRVYFQEKPVKVGEEMDVTITEVSRRGDGLTRVKGYVVFVPNTKEGDSVKIRIAQIRPNYAIGQVI